MIETYLVSGWAGTVSKSGSFQSSVFNHCVHSFLNIIKAPFRKLIRKHWTGRRKRRVINVRSFWNTGGSRDEDLDGDVKKWTVMWGSGWWWEEMDDDSEAGGGEAGNKQRMWGACWIYSFSTICSDSECLMSLSRVFINQREHLTLSWDINRHL